MIFFLYFDIQNGNIMDTLKNIKDLVEKMSVDARKVFLKGNHSASIRARKNAQEIRELLKTFRKEILEEVKKSNNVENIKEEINVSN
jgi:hypothetical protein